MLTPHLSVYEWNYTAVSQSLVKTFFLLIYFHLKKTCDCEDIIVKNNDLFFIFLFLSEYQSEYS